MPHTAMSSNWEGKRSSFKLSRRNRNFAFSSPSKVVQGRKEHYQYSSSDQEWFVQLFIFYIRRKSTAVTSKQITLRLTFIGREHICPQLFLLAIFGSSPHAVLPFGFFFFFSWSIFCPLCFFRIPGWLNALHWPIAYRYLGVTHSFGVFIPVFHSSHPLLMLIQTAGQSCSFMNWHTHFLH